MRSRRFALWLSVLSLVVWASPVRAAAPVDAQDDRVTFAFPDSATFSATLSSTSRITSIVLEYGSRQLSCGDVVAKAFPDFSPNETASVSWTWEMRQSGSLPPGAQLWWRWRYADESGQEYVTTEKTATWVDGVHPWRSLGDGSTLRLHWYEGGGTFAKTLQDAAIAGLEYNETYAGLATTGPIDVYVYADVEDLREAILYEPSWTGGIAFPEHSIVILGIPESDLDWGQDVMVHELTHVLVGHLTFTCLGEMPTWLNEGLAVFAEGGIDPAWQLILDNAVENNSLLPVRSLGGAFSEITTTAVLSYSESYSLVKFLIERGGHEQMRSLLVALRDGAPVDQALSSIYGFDTDGLDEAWRAAIGAPGRPPALLPTARPSPTIVPTIQPISGAWPAVDATAGIATPTATNALPAPAGGVRPPRGLMLALLSVCCVLMLLAGVIVLGVAVRSGRRRTQ